MVSFSTKDPKAEAKRNSGSFCNPLVVISAQVKTPAEVRGFRFWLEHHRVSGSIDHSKKNGIIPEDNSVAPAGPIRGSRCALLLASLIKICKIDVIDIHAVGQLFFSAQRISMIPTTC